MILLTPEQSEQLHSEGFRFLDPQTQAKYVLVTEELYERLEFLLVPERLTAAEQQAALRSVGLRASWDDPEMEVYDREENS